MQSAGRPAATHVTKMASAVSTNPFHTDDSQGPAACGAAETAEGSPPSGQEWLAGSGSEPAAGSPSRPRGPASECCRNMATAAVSGALVSNLNSVYFDDAEAASERSPRSTPASFTRNDTAGIHEGPFTCVLWELEQLPRDGELFPIVVSRLEHLKACSDEASRSLSCQVAERREELTKAASVIGELRAALESLRRESAGLRTGLTQFRREYLRPSLAITKLQQTKLTLQQEVQQLLQIQRLEAILMAAENSCVSRELPLQAALLVEGAALFLSPRDMAPPSSLPPSADQAAPDLSMQSGIKKMQQMLKGLKADLNAAIQAAARSLPPPPCGCGWRVHQNASHGSSQGLRWLSSTSSISIAAATGTGEDTWQSYYSALAAYALLPPSSPVGSAVSAAVAAAAAAATRQVLCAFVPADAAAFSETEPEGLEVQRACARLMFQESQHSVAASAAAVTADAVAALPSAKDLGASVDATDSIACFMSLLGVHYDILLGAASLMRWHASEAFRLLAEVREERTRATKGGPLRPDTGTDARGLSEDSSSRRSSCSTRIHEHQHSEWTACSSHSEDEFMSTYELAASATQRLRALPSKLRMALFLLQVRKQFLCQRGSLWQQLQQQTAEVLQQLDLGSGASTAVSDCLSLMQAVRAFVTIGESFVAAEDTAAENQLAAEAAAVAAAVAATDTSTPTGMSIHPFGAAADAETAAAAAVAADAAAAAATATAVSAAGQIESTPSSPPATALPQVLLVRVNEAIESLYEIHTQDLLKQVTAETWQRLPMLRRYPLVLLRSSAPMGSLALLQGGMNPSVVTAACDSSGVKAGSSSTLCGCCGETIVTSAVPNPFARWQPGKPFGGADTRLRRREKGGTAAVELAAIEEELRAAEAWEACGRRSDEPPVAVAASQAAAQAIMQYWQLAVSAPEVAAAAVRAMIRLMGFSIAAVAASTLPEDICSCLAASPMQVPAHFADMSSRAKITATAEAALLRCRLPHLHWLLSQADQGLQQLHKRLSRGSSSEMSASATAGSRMQRPVLSELIRPMARLASPGALWGLAERVAAVESVRDLLEALGQQLHLQGLPQDFGDNDERQKPIGRSSSEALLRNLPREEQQQLWRLLAATRCAVEDLRALVYRVAAASLCQSNAFLASFQQVAGECGADKFTAGAPRDSGRVSAASTPSDAVLRAYTATVEQHRRQVADLYWRIRCAGSGSIPANVQRLIWRAVRSQTVADAIDALSSVPLPVDPVERCLHPGPLVAVSEVLRGIIAEAHVQYCKAAVAAGFSVSEEQKGSFPPMNVACANHAATEKAPGNPNWIDSSSPPLDLSEADFDCFLDVCSRTAPEVMRWCQEQRKRACQRDEGCKVPPLVVMSQMLQRLENAGLLQKGQTAEFKNKQGLALMQLMQPPPPPS